MDLSSDALRMRADRVRDKAKRDGKRVADSARVTQARASVSATVSGPSSPGGDAEGTQAPSSGAFVLIRGSCLQSRSVDLIETKWDIA